MKLLRFFTVACLLTGAVSAPSRAQERPAIAVPQAVPEEIATSAFASRPQIERAVISPDGSRFVVTRNLNGTALLTVYDSASLKPVVQKVLAASSENHLDKVMWAGNGKVLVSMGTYTSIMMIPNVHVSRLFALDVESGDVDEVGFDRQGIEGDDVLFTDPHGRYIILSLNEDLLEQPDVYHVPLDGQGMENAVKVQKRMRLVDEWWADDAGVVRLGIGTKDGKMFVHYRSGPDDKFERVAKVKEDTDEFDNWDVSGLYAGSDLGYALIGGEDGRVALHGFDYSSGTPGDVVFAHDEWDIRGIAYDEAGKPVGARYFADTYETHWLSPQWEKRSAALAKALPGGSVDVLDLARNGRALVRHGGAHDPGALYFYDPEAKRLDLVGNFRPEIDHRKLARTTAVTYAARDALPIRAYLTLPPGRAAKNLPLIVLPHGGPYGVRDGLSYNDEVQLLANRGYAVIQPNFRGSGGYGLAFEMAGTGQIGRAMQDDLDDAMDWAVKEGIADPQRVCMVGSSYGGYAAMWSVIRNPERYRCAASWAGVTDFKTQYRYTTRYSDKDREGRKWRRQIRGMDEDRLDLTDISPARRLSQLTRPLLVAHGKDDGVVPFDQFERMVKEAEEAGVKLDTLVIEDTGHSFAEAEHEQAWYDALVAFLAKHNPPDPVPANDP